MSTRPPESILASARKLEADHNEPHYVVHRGAIYTIVKRMPMFGEWYSSDGLQHGA